MRSNATNLARNVRFQPFPSIAFIAASPLLRHLAALHIKDACAFLTPLDNASLGLLEQFAPNLQSLGCRLTLTSTRPLPLPDKLLLLHLQLDAQYTDAEINGVLTALAALPSLSLHRLGLDAVRWQSSVDFTLVAACRSLTHFLPETLLGNPLRIPYTQREQIRVALGHLQRCSLGRLDTDELAHYLRQPCTLRWQDIGLVEGGARTGRLLLRLPTLTKLDVIYVDDLAHVDFLPQLPHLAVLNLQCGKFTWDEKEVWLIPADTLLASFLLCNGLTELSLWCGFTSAHWSALFAKLPLKKLTIRGGAIETLACFAAGPITHSLEELTIYDLEIPPSELSHLHALSRLRTLHLHECFSLRLDEATIASLSPPTPLLPAPTALIQDWRFENPGQEFIHRQGPSFEWVRQRLTP